MHDEYKFYIYTLLLNVSPPPQYMDQHMEVLQELYTELLRTEYSVEVEDLMRMYMGLPPMIKIN